MVCPDSREQRLYNWWFSQASEINHLLIEVQIYDNYLYLTHG